MTQRGPIEEAARGTSEEPLNRVLSLRSYYRFLISEDLCGSQPRRGSEAPEPDPTRVEFYTDQERDEIIARASGKPSLRWPVRTVVLVTLRFTGLRLEELASHSCSFGKPAPASQ